MSFVGLVVFSLVAAGPVARRIGGASTVAVR
jgi:hypothetical protein